MSTYEDQGWVRPVTDGNEGSMDPIEPTGRTIRSSVMAAVILIAVIGAAIVGTVLWRSRTGDPFASARSVPADMGFVVTFDALALSDSERLQAFVDAFAVPMVEAEMIDDYPDDLVAAIDEAMAEESDFTLTGDILPWIGRSVSLAFSVPEVNPDTFEMEELSFLLSADVRDRAAADAFVEKVLAEMASNDVEVTATTIGGAPGWVWQEADGDVAVGLVVTDDALLAGVEGDVADAIAARDAGLSIADDATFIDTMSRLPDERMVSFYMSPSALDSVYEMAAMFGESAAIDEDLFGAAGASVALVDEGVRFNSVTMGGQLTETPLEPDHDVLAGLPDGTLGFFSVADGGSDTDLYTEQLLDQMGTAIDELSYQTGIDIGALLESLSGDVTFAVAETREGVIANQAEVPVGVVAAFGLNDPDPINDLIEMIEQSFSGSGLEFDQSGGVTTVYDRGQEIVSYSAGDEMVVVGTGAGLVDGLVSGEDGGLTASDLYTELDGLVIGNGLVGYVNISGIVDIVPLTQDEAAVFAPLRGIGYGGERSDDAFEMEVLILVDY